MTDDVLKARLKTVGVSEYSFHMEAGDERGTEWRIIDVGGSRSQVRLIFLLSSCRVADVVRLSGVSSVYRHPHAVFSDTPCPSHLGTLL